MSRVLVMTFLLLCAAGTAAWIKRDEVFPLVREHVPAAAPYLDKLAALAESRPEASSTVAATSRRQAEVLPVVVAPVELRSVPIVIEAVGTVQSMASIQLKARIDTQIDKVNVAEGALVRLGDLLFTLDTRALRAQLAQTEAQIARDKAQLDQARRDLARAEDLLSRRINSEVQRDNAMTAYKVAQAQLASDEAQRDNLAVNVAYGEIRAPVAGRMGSIPSKAGTVVRLADTSPLATLNQIDPIYVAFAVPQSAFDDLRTAMLAGDVKVEARVGSTLVPGRLTFLENQVDLSTGTVTARAQMQNKEERLWPGAFVSVKVTLGIEDNAVAIPATAVQMGQQGPYVFVVRDGKTAELLPVKIGRTAGSDVVVTSGLKGGESVVVDGQLRLVAGAPVQLHPNKATAGSDSPPQRPERRS